MTWQEQLLERASDRRLAEIVIESIERLLEHDRKLLEIDAHERAIAHRLAVHIEELLPGWDVDCEYNRKGHDEPKTLDLETSDHEQPGEGSLVFPDIIVHHRTVQDNLLVIEIKKSTAQRSDAHDEKKLRAFLGQLKYHNGLFLKIGCGAQASDVVRVWWASL